MDVSVIIVNFNTSTLLHRCLHSIKEKTFGVEYEIIVIDNASSDDSVRFVKSNHADVHVIESETNIGFGKANNLGSEQAKGKYLFFLNSDTELLNDAISHLFHFMETHPRCGIAGGNLVNASGDPTHSYRRTLPGPISELYRFIPSLIPIVEGKNWHFNHTRKPMEVGYITGADMMIRRDLFTRLGAFDPDFFMYYEEAELTRRVRNSGQKAYSVPAARILHLKGSSLEFLSSAKSVVYRSKYLYLKKTYGPRAAWRAHWYFQFYCYYKRLLHILFGSTAGKDRYERMAILDRSIYYE